MDKSQYLVQLKQVLVNAINIAKENKTGKVADYIPELAHADINKLSVCIRLTDNSIVVAGDLNYRYTLQSVAKLIVLIGMLEEFGEQKIFTWIGAEPSGYSFSSIAQLDRFGPVPSNPMLNAGALALCSQILGSPKEQKQWLDKWANILFGHPLFINEKVFSSELKASDKNRSIAYLLKSNGVISRDVEMVLETYFYLCSYELDSVEASYLPMLLANGGLSPKGERIISENTSNCVVSIMATCGLYDESGMHLVRTGMPAKSGVSGLIIATAAGRGGIAVSSPLVNAKFGSVKGHMIIEHISHELGWHFASPYGYLRR